MPRLTLLLLALSIFVAGTSASRAHAQAAPAPAAAPSDAPAAASPAEPLADTIATAPLPAVPTTSAPEPAASPEAAPATAPVAPAPPASGTLACVLGDHLGVPDADAHTAASLVCSSLHDAGANVDDQPSDDSAERASYRVSLQPLGKLIVLQVSLRSSSGATQRTESLQLKSIEEVPVASLRIADALMHKKSLDQTAAPDTLVGEETRSYKKRTGETLFAVGVLGVGLLGERSAAGYGVFGRLYYETPAYAVGAELRVGGSAESTGDASLVGLSVGGRYFMLDGDFSPFAGAGLGILWMGLDGESVRSEYGYNDSAHLYGSGIAPFLEGGIELLRLYESRVDLFVRVDVPVFSLSPEYEESVDDQYTVPVSVMASYSFD